MELTKSQSAKAKIGVIALSFLIMSHSSSGVTLASMAAAFPEVAEVNIQLVVGIVSLVAMPVSLLSIPLARKFSCKWLLIAVQLIYAVSSLLIYFFPTNFGFILAMRVLTGVGRGMIDTVIIATCGVIFSGNDRAIALGFRNAAAMAGGITTSFVSGYLTLINWQTAYLVYAIGIITALIGFVCMPECKLPAAPKPNTSGEKIPFSKKLTKDAVLVIIKAGLMISAVHQSAVNIAFHLTAYNIGDASNVGLCNSFMMGLGIVSSAIVGKVFSRTKRWTADFGFALLAIGLIGTGLSRNIILIYMFQAIMGFGLGCYEPPMQTIMTRAMNPAYMAVATGLFSFLQTFGQFASPYAITPLGDTTVRYLVAGGIAVAVLIFDLFTNKAKWYGTNYPADEELPKSAQATISAEAEGA